jgi:hypothetical protein
MADYLSPFEPQKEENKAEILQEKETFHDEAIAALTGLPDVANQLFAPYEDQNEMEYQQNSADIVRNHEDMLVEADSMLPSETISIGALLAEQKRREREAAINSSLEEQLGENERRRLDRAAQIDEVRKGYTEQGEKDILAATKEVDKAADKAITDADDFWDNYPFSLIDRLPETPPADMWNIPTEEQPWYWEKFEDIPVSQRDWPMFFGLGEGEDVRDFLKTHTYLMTGGIKPVEVFVTDLVKLGKPPFEWWQSMEEENPELINRLKKSGVPMEEWTFSDFFDLSPGEDWVKYVLRNPYLAEGREPTREEMLSGLPQLPFASVAEATGYTTWEDVFGREDWLQYFTDNPDAAFRNRERDEAMAKGYWDALKSGGLFGVAEAAKEKAQAYWFEDAKIHTLGWLSSNIEKWLMRPWAAFMYKYLAPTIMEKSERGREILAKYGYESTRELPLAPWEPGSEAAMEYMESWPWPVTFALEVINPLFWLPFTAPVAWPLKGMAFGSRAIPGIGGRFLEPAFKGAAGKVELAGAYPMKIAGKALKRGGSEAARAIGRIGKVSTASMVPNAELIAARGLTKEAVEALSPMEKLAYYRIELGSPETILAAVDATANSVYGRMANTHVIPFLAGFKERTLKRVSKAWFAKEPPAELFVTDPVKWGEMHATRAALLRGAVNDQVTTITDLLLRFERAMGVPESKLSTFGKVWETDAAKLFDLDTASGLIASGPLKGKALREVFEQRPFDLMTKEQASWIRTADNIIDIHVDLAERLGLTFPQLHFGPDAHYFPSVIESKFGKTFGRTKPAAGVRARGRGLKQPRARKSTGELYTQEEMLEFGFRYVPPQEALKQRMYEIGSMISDKYARDYIKKAAGGSTERALAIKSPDIAKKMTNANRSKRAYEAVLERLEILDKTGTLPWQSLRAIDKFDADMGKMVRDIMSERKVMRLEEEIRGKVVSSAEIRKAAEEIYQVKPTPKQVEGLVAKAGGLEGMSGVDAKVIREGLELERDALEVSLREASEELAVLEGNLATNPAREYTGLLSEIQLGKGKELIPVKRCEKVLGRRPHSESLTPDGKYVYAELMLDDLARTLGYEEKAAWESVNATDLLIKDMQMASQSKESIKTLTQVVKNNELQLGITNKFLKQMEIVKPGVGPAKLTPEDAGILRGAEAESTVQKSLNKMEAGKLLANAEVIKIAEHLQLEATPSAERGAKWLITGKKGTAAEGAKFVARDNTQAAMYLNEVEKLFHPKVGVPPRPLHPASLKSPREFWYEVKDKYKSFMEGEFKKTTEEYKLALAKAKRPLYEEGRINHPAFGNMIVPNELAREVNKVLSDKGSPFWGRFRDVGTAMRMFKASADFSAAFIQLLPIMFYKPDIWLKAEVGQFRTFMNPEFYNRYMIKNMDAALEAATHGVYFGGFEYLESFEPMVRWFEKRGITQPAGKFMNQTFGRFNAAFGYCGDYARTELWKGLSATWRGRLGEEGLTRLGRELNLMTGVTSMNGLGIGITQQQFESGVLFFAPRYTRAGLELFADLFRGGLEGELAWKSLGSFLAVPPMLFMGFNAATGRPLGEGLDPLKGNFLKMRIGDRYIGVGGIHYGLVRALAQSVATVIDPEENKMNLLNPFKTRTKDGKTVLNRWDNPLMKFMFNRAAMLSSTAYLMGVERNRFFGEPLESPEDYLEYAATQFVPIWLSDTFLEGRRPTGVLGPTTAVVALLGMNTYPISAYQIEKELRDRYCEMEYKRPWEELLPSERDELYKAHPDLEEAREESNRVATYYADSIQPLWNEWEVDRERIKEDTKRKLEVAEQMFLRNMREGVMNQWQCSSEYRQSVQEVMAWRNGRMQGLEENERYAPIYEFMAEPRKDESVPVATMALDEYEEMMYGNPFLNALEGTPEYYDYRDELEEEFINKWGEDMYDIVQQERRYTFDQKEYPQMYRELTEARRILRPYWDIQKTFDKIREGLPPSYAKLFDVQQEAMQSKWREENPEGDYYLQLFYGKSNLLPGIVGKLRTKRIIDDVIAGRTTAIIK